MITHEQLEFLEVLRNYSQQVNSSIKVTSDSVYLVQPADTNNQLYLWEDFVDETMDNDGRLR